MKIKWYFNFNIISKVQSKIKREARNYFEND